MASAQAQTVKIVGIGASSCAKFLEDIESNPQLEREYFSWAQGYMSGLLIRAPSGKDENLDLTPSAFPVRQQLEFLRLFCQGSLNAEFSIGVDSLYRTLRGPGG